MKRLINFLFLTIIFAFVFNISVYAECSYQERKELLNSAKNVDISFELKDKEEEYVGINPNSGLEETIKQTIYYFDLNIIGITENMFLSISNDYDSEEIVVNYEDLSDGSYSLEINNSSDLIKYYIQFYSNKDNCYAEKIITKKITKPKLNPIYNYSICLNDKVSNHEYCKQFINKDFNKSETDIIEELNNIINDENESNNKVKNDNAFLNFFINYWYVFLLGLIIISTVIVVIIIRKKRSRL